MFDATESVGMSKATDATASVVFPRQQTLPLPLNAAGLTTMPESLPARAISFTAAAVERKTLWGAWRSGSDADPETVPFQIIMRVLETPRQDFAPSISRACHDEIRTFQQICICH